MQPATIANRYLPLQPLGEGGMGSVWLARDLRSGLHIAVKFLRSDLAPDPTQRARFFREAYAAASLRNEHVVQVHEVGALPTGVPFLVMEYLQGLDLGALLEQRGPLPVDAAVGYVAQACVGLTAVHAAGIIHRDLKPANLLLLARPDGSPLVKVLDFGVARASSSGAALTGVHGVVGTPQCMAPEQYDGRSAELTAAADVWALGCILYKLLEGRYPYEGETLGELLVNIATTPMQAMRRGDVPAGLMGVIERCLRLDPGQRFADAGEVRQALSPWVPAWARAGASGSTVEMRAMPVGTAPMAGAALAVAGGQRRRPLQAWRAVGLGAVAAGLLGASVLGSLVVGGVYLVFSAIPNGQEREVEIPLKIADTARVDPMELLPQVEAAVRKLEPAATFVSLSAAAVPPGLADTSQDAIYYTFVVPGGATVQGGVRQRSLWAKRTVAPAMPKPALGPRRCSMQSVSRVASAATGKSEKTAFALIFDDRGEPVWRVGFGKLKFDGRTCARLPLAPRSGRRARAGG